MRVIIDFWVFLCTLTGYIPSHIIRLFLYKTFFRISIGKHSTIHWRAEFNVPSGIRIGNNTIIGNDAFLDGRYKRVDNKVAGLRKMLIYLRDFIQPTYFPISIGDNVSIAGEVRIYSMEHDINSSDFKEIGDKVVIEDYVVIGSRVMILPGVTVGKGAVIASGAVVTKNVAPYTVVGGVPARYIQDRSKNLTYKLQFARLFQ